jgi:hypothetical protein
MEHTETYHHVKVWKDLAKRHYETSKHAGSIQLSKNKEKRGSGIFDLEVA